MIFDFRHPDLGDSDQISTSSYPLIGNGHEMTLPKRLTSQRYPGTSVPAILSTRTPLATIASIQGHSQATQSDVGGVYIDI